MFYTGIEGTNFDKIGYDDFLVNKSQCESGVFGNKKYIPSELFDFQCSLVDWALDKSRSAIFADTGLGKTAMQLVWSQNIVEKTNGRILILTPLAVAKQTVSEGDKFGIQCIRSRGEIGGPGIYVTNYQQLHHFDPNDFVGTVCDESSILKNFKGSTKQDITAFMRKHEYRLLATATPSPNDFVEMGTSSEALGYLGYIDMLNKFFVNEQNNSGMGRVYGKVVKWRFKGHAEHAFWRWLVSWARAIRRPSDLGYSDDRFILPELIEREHDISTSETRPGELFAMPATNLHEQRQERRLTLGKRCELAAELLTHDDPAIAWAHLNDETDMLERLIHGAVQVSGSQSDEQKEEYLSAFQKGEIRALVTKPKIAGFGLNWQHCAHMTVFPSHSFEQYYQSVRRCWRFGQTKPVTVDVVTSEGERGVLENLRRKMAQAETMMDTLVSLMGNELLVRNIDEYNTNMEIPSWL